MKALTVLTIIASICFFSCKNSSQAMESNRIEPTNSGKNKIENQEEGVYDIIISFASKGEGIKRDIREKLDNTISKFNESNNVTVNVEKYGWGREGEVDYLFLTKNLSTKQAKDLKAKVKAVVEDSELIFISYDSKCVHKR